MTNPVSGLRPSGDRGHRRRRDDQRAREWGFVETLRGAMDQVKQLQGTADHQGGGLLEGNGMDVHSAHDCGGKSRPFVSADDAGAEQDCGRVSGDLAHAILKRST